MVRRAVARDGSGSANLQARETAFSPVSRRRSGRTQGAAAGTGSAARKVRLNGLLPRHPHIVALRNPATGALRRPAVAAEEAEVTLVAADMAAGIAEFGRKPGAMLE